MLLKLFRGQMKLIVKTKLSTQTFAQTPKVMSYILQQKHHTYINYDVNRLANVCLDNSAYNLLIQDGMWNVLTMLPPNKRAVHRCQGKNEK